MLGETDNMRQVMLPPASPAWLFPTPEASVAFNWGRHNTLTDDQTLRLRLFVVSDGTGETQWQVEWKWVTSVESMGGPNPPFTLLGNLLPANNSPQLVSHPGLDGGVFQLNASGFFELTPDGENPVGEYLIVRITLVARDVETGIVGLLLAEVNW